MHSNVRFLARRAPMKMRFHFHKRTISVVHDDTHMHVHAQQTYTHTHMFMKQSQCACTRARVHKYTYTYVLRGVYICIANIQYYRRETSRPDANYAPQLFREIRRYVCVSVVCVRGACTCTLHTKTRREVRGCARPCALNGRAHSVKIAT